MKRQIYVLGRGIAVAEDDRPVEYVPCAHQHSAAESILLGKVVRVVKGMQAAFVDIGQEKNGFLPLSQSSASFTAPALRQGMHVLVQVKKDAHDGKGAFLTRDISLCGTLVLVMPLNRYVGVSNRISGDGTRKALKELGVGIAGDRFGIVLREAALEAEQPDILSEAEELFAQWSEISRAAATAHAPSIVYEPRTPLRVLLDDYLPRGVDEAVTDDPAFECGDVPLRRVEAESDEIRRLIRMRDKALERRVWLDSGANLVIDPCEAMTVIDVNTARFTGKKVLEETILKTNLEAAAEIVRQVRLRNLSGMILIDMIDMQTDDERAAVLQALQEGFRQDRIKTVIHGFTSLGLIEMTRKKTRVPLRDALTVPCSHCGGTGRLLEEEEHA